MKKALFVFSVAAAILVGQERGRGGDGRFMNPLVTALDADRDGVISAAEIKNAPKALASLDKDKDGKITREEIRPNFGPGGAGGRRPEGNDERAGSGGNGNAEMIKTLMAFDKNGDGKLSKEEVPERMQGIFTRGDLNGDGFLSKDEIQKLATASAGSRSGQGEGEGRRRPGGPSGPGGGPQGMRMDPVFAVLDIDGDGVISASEIKAAAASLAKLDKNGDGKISQDELRPNMSPGGPMGGDPTEMIDHMFAENDKNGDGKLSKAEAPERLQEMFDRADQNKDGFLTKDELKKMFEGLGQGRRQ